MSEMLIFWLVVLILSIGIEVATLGLVSIWFAGGSLVAIIAAALNAPLVVQVLLFLAMSMVLLFFTRPVAVKYFNKDRVKTNVESLVGRQAIVVSEVDNLLGIGQVAVGGQEWSARSVNPEVKLPAGCVVVVRAISGVKLMVEEDPQMDNITGEQKAQPQPAVSIEPEEE